jgi:hypothetical protein
VNKLEQLHELRNKAGIVFDKSFNCKDAEKNIHLIDKDKFFKKFVERLRQMGYEPSEDFTFDIIRTKYPYAERHHIGRTYEWKYFYSTTFQITGELIEFLIKHNFITNDKTRELNALDVQIIGKENDLKRKQIKLERNKTLLSGATNLGQEQSVANYKTAIERTKKNIAKIEKAIDELKKQREVILNGESEI